MNEHTQATASIPDLDMLRQQAERAAAAGDHTSAVAAYSAALALLPEPPSADTRELVYDLLLARATCLYHLGSYSAAEADLVMLIDIARALGDPAREMDVIYQQVRVAVPQGKVAEIRPVVEAMLERAQTLDDQLLGASALAARAYVGFRVGDFVRARSDAEAALIVFKAHDMPAGAARAHWTLAAISANTGELTLGHAHAEAALIHYQMIGDRLGQAIVLNAMGNASIDYAHQRDIYRQALALFAELGNRHGQSVVSANLGWVYLVLGLYRRATAYFEQAMLFCGMQGGMQDAYILQFLGALALEQGDANQAIELLSQGYSSAQATSDVRQATLCSFLLGRAALECRDFERAERLFEEAANRFVTLDAPGDRAAALAWSGASALQRGDFTAARAATADAVALLEVGATSVDIAAHEVWWWRYQALRAAAQSSVVPNGGGA